MLMVCCNSVGFFHNFSNFLEREVACVKNEAVSVKACNALVPVLISSGLREWESFAIHCTTEAAQSRTAMHRLRAWPSAAPGVALLAPEARGHNGWCKSAQLWLPRQHNPLAPKHIWEWWQGPLPHAGPCCGHRTSEPSAKTILRPRLSCAGAPLQPCSQPNCCTVKLHGMKYRVCPLGIHHL